MKIDLVFLHPHFTLPGGAGNVVLECASRLDSKKYNIRVLCIRADPEYKEKYPNLSFVEVGGPLSSSMWFWVGFPVWQYRIHRKLNQFFRPILIPQVLPSNWWAFIYKIFNSDIRCLWYCHEPSAFIHSSTWIDSIPNPVVKATAKALNPILKLIDRFLVAKGTDRVLCNSKFTTKLYLKSYGKNITDILYPGIDFDRFAPRNGEKKYLFMVSRLTRFKNIHIAIEAMARIAHNEYQLIIGGDGEEKNNLIALSEKLNLADRVSFIGQLSFQSLLRRYSEAKLVLFTSRDEPFGLVPVEALACGTPVIAFNSGGLRETIKHDHNGILVDDLTIESFTNAIDDLLANPIKYRWLQNNARSSVEHFNWNEHIKKLETVLENLATQRVE